MAQTIAVIGAGTMGSGIAHVFAQAGYAVELIDVNNEQLQKAMTVIEKNTDRQLSKGIITGQTKADIVQLIHPSVNLATGVQQADIVIEAATENAATKMQLFTKIDEAAPAHAILASNTSSISITTIASVTKRPGSVIGMHFMNPVPVMKLVEVINGYATRKEVTQQIVEISRQLGKIPCVANDYPGFVANRILMPMINEAVFSLFEGVADVEAIDTIMKLGMAHPMGPLQLADFIGLDICLSILQVLHQESGNPKYAPCPLLKNMVMAGYLGLKSGEGFYRYTPGSKELVVSERFL